MPFYRERHGISVNNKLFSMQPNGMTESIAGIKTESGTEQAVTISITDTPYILCYNALNVLQTGGIIQGICKPGYIKIKLSYCSHDQICRLSLATSVFAEVQAVGGRWQYQTMAFASNEIVAWFALDAGVSRDNECEIDCAYTAQIEEGDIITSVVYPFVNELKDPDSGVGQYPNSRYTITGAPEESEVIMSELKDLETVKCPACDGKGCDACNDSGYIPIIPELSTDILGEVKGSALTEGGMALIEFDGTYTAPGAPHTHVYIAFFKGLIGSIHVEGKFENELVCLSGDTMIRLYDGTEKRLDELDGSEYLMSSDGKPTPIKQIKSGTYSMRSKYYTFSDGTVIHETNPHRFYNATQGFFQWLPAWEIGDEAVRYDGAKVQLASVREVSERCEMFGLWTESDTYFAGGLLSGTAEANIPLLATGTLSAAIRMAASLTDRQMEIFMEDGGMIP